MYVHYYDIRNCTYDTFQNSPVLVAPFEGYSPRQLEAFGFTQFDDGRYLHFLNEGEYARVMEHYPDSVAVFSADASGTQAESDRNRGNVLCFTALGLLLASWLSWRVIPRRSLYLSIPFYLASLLLTIICRVRYPENKYGRAVMIALIAVFGVSAVALIFFAAWCGIAAGSCCGEVRNCQG